jgi:tRNA A37 threonylcarbamoyladenosine dehydratase
VGVGGVGSWAAEALARCGVGTITLIDLDHIAESNLNRQVHALHSTLGAAKVEVMRARLLDIAPACRVNAVDEFIDPANVAQLVPGDAVVIDAIDAPRAKAALIALCRDRGQTVIVCGAAGGRTDPLCLASEDLALTRGDALLAGVRARLRRDHGFSREAGRRFGVAVVYSTEPPARTTAGGRAGATVAIAPGVGAAAVAGGAAPLSCAGYGSLVTVTAPMGMAAAALALRALNPPAGRKVPPATARVLAATARAPAATAEVPATPAAERA